MPYFIKRPIPIEAVQIRMYNSLPDYQKKKFIESHDASIMALPR